MTDKHFTVDSIRWRSVLPWLQLLRAADLALRIRVLVLSLLAVIVFTTGNSWLRELPFVKSSGDQELFPLLSDVSRFGPEPEQFQSLRSDVIWERIVNRLTWPLQTVVVPAARLFQLNSSWPRIAAAWTSLLWSLLIWAIFAGAGVRMLAVRFAREESLSLRAALTFSIRNWQSYLYGPLLPMLGVGFFALVAYALHSANLVINDGLKTALWLIGFLPIACGFAMAFLLVLMAVSWPLMVAAISTEGSDGFDGLSRSFGYVMNRPWYLLSLTVSSLLIGALTGAFVWLFFDLAAWLTDWSLGQGFLANSQFFFWREAFKLGFVAVLVSYFWSATTVIYFLLRQSEDGTPLDQVYIPGPPPKPELLPVVGVAASQQPVIERPATEAGETKT